MDPSFSSPLGADVDEIYVTSFLWRMSGISQPLNYFALKKYLFSTSS